MVSIQHLLQYGSLQLTSSSESPHLDTEILLQHLLKVARSFLYTYPEYELSAEQYQQFLQLLKLRQQGKPVAYIVGYKEFWSLTLKVSAATLIPRPETESLVELTLNCFKPQDNIKILDLGTGCGAIALALATTRPHWQLMAVDSEEAALEIAQQNAALHHIKNVEFRQSHWFNNVTLHDFDAIVSNPPYIASNDPHLLHPALQHEPLNALVSEKEGLADLKHIINHSSHYLKPKGFLILEHGYQQQLIPFMEMAGFINCSTQQDFSGNDRVTVGQAPAKKY